MDEDVLIASVGTRLKQLRYAAGYTQEVMAVRVGSGLRNYQRLETGLVNMSLRTLARLATALQVGPADLLAQTPPRSLARPSVADKHPPNTGKRRPRRRQ